MFLALRARDVGRRRGAAAQLVEKLQREVGAMSVLVVMEQTTDAGTACHGRLWPRAEIAAALGTAVSGCGGGIAALAAELATRQLAKVIAVDHPPAPIRRMATRRLWRN
jgi:hypothetical protein